MSHFCQRVLHRVLYQFGSSRDRRLLSGQVSCAAPSPTFQVGQAIWLEKLVPGTVLAAIFAAPNQMELDLLANPCKCSSFSCILTECFRFYRADLFANRSNPLKDRSLVRPLVPRPPVTVWQSICSMLTTITLLRLLRCYQVHYTSPCYY